MDIQLTPEQRKAIYDNGWDKEHIEATIKAHPDMDKDELILKMTTIVNPNLEQVKERRINEQRDLETIKKYASNDRDTIWKRAQGKTKGIDVTPKGIFNKGVPALMLALDAMKNPQNYNEDTIQDIEDVIGKYFEQKNKLLKAEEQHQILTTGGEMVGYLPYAGESAIVNYGVIPAYIGATEAIASGKDPVQGAITGVLSAGAVKGGMDIGKAGAKGLAKLL